jgi:hypothetical protein
MAGAGAKKFPAFSKLASADVNDYLADQVIMRFATTTARDAAFGGLGEPALAEGMTCYIDNLNVLQTYDGSNWVTTTALQTTRDVSSGFAYIGSVPAVGNRPLTVGSVFNSEYLNYRIVLNMYGSSASDEWYLRFLNASAVEIATANYTRYGVTQTTTGAVASAYVDSANRLTLGALTTNSQQLSSAVIDVFNANTATRTTSHFKSFSMATGQNLDCTMQLSLTDVLTGFVIYGLNGNVFGDCKIYGYRN